MAVVVLYAASIQEAVVSGDVARMRALVQQAEDHLKEWGNISAALELLKLEIAKLEGKPYSP
jgi:hypothetical protein